VKVLSKSSKKDNSPQRTRTTAGMQEVEQRRSSCRGHEGNNPVNSKH